MISINYGTRLSGTVIVGNAIDIGGRVNVNTVSFHEKDYEILDNLPRINNITLIGNKTSEDLGLEPTIVDITEQEIDQIIYGG